MFANHKQRKALAKLEKLQRRVVNVTSVRDKHRWKQLVHAGRPHKVQRQHRKEAAAAAKITKLRVEMARLCPDPTSLFPSDQVVWHAAMYGLHAVLDAHLTTHGLAQVEGRVGPAGDTPLLVAAAQGYLDIVHLLVLRAHANINATNSLGLTALHCAASAHHADVITFLLQQQASPYVRDMRGHLPIDMARNCAFNLGDVYSQYASCVRVLEAATTARTGWVLESQRDNLLNRYILSSVGLTTHLWHQRYVVVMHSDVPHEMEIALYDPPMDNVLSALPVLSLAWTKGSPITPVVKTTLNNYDFTFSLVGRQKYPVLPPGVPQAQPMHVYEFAVKIGDELADWLDFFHSLTPDAPQDELFPLPVHPGGSTSNANVDDDVHELFPTANDSYRELFPTANGQVTEMGRLPMAVPVKTVDVYVPPPPPTVLAAPAPSPPVAESEMLPGPTLPHRDCVVCHYRPQEGVCVPCGHRAVCMACADTIVTQEVKSCPICRANVREIIRLFDC
ncbi:Aste57867_9326 [Aphanomyces stellatus]|uniref:Aste57867_9326 protein n=1 Tax=Aphanomyces stellatus TaxID=120398 RepID=A0A485KMX7_9STRA|nr:hypothetical protein As57867_009290 [Aphanomyces stellatus]VFT86208.1 Aste57867_9326 [Aphanomyces stellatus]